MATLKPVILDINLGDIEEKTQSTTTSVARGKGPNLSIGLGVTVNASDPKNIKIRPYNSIPVDGYYWEEYYPDEGHFYISITSNNNLSSSKGSKFTSASVGNTQQNTTYYVPGTPYKIASGRGDTTSDSQTNIDTNAWFIANGPGTYTFKVEWKNNSETGNYCPNSYTGEVTVNVIAYNIQYETNGASNDEIFITQYKQPGQNLILHSANPIYADGQDANGSITIFEYKSISFNSAITKYTFLNWTSTEGKSYNPGSSYQIDKNTILTAQKSSTIFGTVTLPSAGDLIKPGYILRGYDTSSQGTSIIYNPGQSISNIEAGTILYPVWAAKEYTATFDARGGTGPYPQTITKKYGLPLGTLPTTTREGYDFLGWYTDAILGTEIKDFDTLVGNTTYYAHWAPSKETKYKVKHYLMNTDGESYTLEESEELTGVTGEIIKPSVKNYSGFTSPQETQETIRADGRTEIRYDYTRNKYTITFNSQEGTTCKSITDYYEKTIELPSPTKSGFNFDNWYLDLNYQNQATNKIPLGNKTYYAKWAPIGNVPYKVIHKYMNKEGKYDGLDEIKEDRNGPAETLITPNFKERDGFANPAPQEVTINKNGSTEVIYEYERNKYTINFNSKGGSFCESITDYYEKEIILPQPEWENHTFDGWYLDSGYSSKATNTIPLNNKTYYAKWISNLPTQYTVNFYTDGLLYVSKNVNVGGNLLNNFPTPPTKKGYKFIRWFDRVGNREITQNTLINKNIDCYAEWEELPKEEIGVIYLFDGDKWIKVGAGEGASEGGSGGGGTSDNNHTHNFNQIVISEAEANDVFSVINNYNWGAK